MIMAAVVASFVSLMAVAIENHIKNMLSSIVDIAMVSHMHHRPALLKCHTAHLWLVQLDFDLN